ncbi:MAG: electron transfer flavoprotein subunit beta/FixA family protein [Desulfatiglandaceae bacterium]
MDIIVCVKRVPLTQEVDLEIEADGKGIKKGDLAWVVNDWDNYAVEEAVRLQEELGGSVTAVTLGGEDDEEVLRRALAMGADRAIRIDPGSLELDGFVISRILAQAIRDLDHDLVLTGVQADDDNYGMVGVLLAEHLGLSHAAVVTSFEPQDGEATVHVELEGGMDGVSRIRLPALLTVQTGINEPRYVSIMGIRKARKKELQVLQAQELGIPEPELQPKIMVEEVFLPPETEGAEMLEGDSGTVAEKILQIMREKGVSI